MTAIKQQLQVDSVKDFSNQCEDHHFHFDGREGWGEDLSCPPPCFPMGLEKAPWPASHRAQKVRKIL